MKQHTFSRRQFLQMSALTSISITLAACTQVAAPARSGAAAAPTGDKMTITIWGWWEERMKFFQAAGDDYAAENPNIEVLVETFGDEIWTKVFAAVPAGTGPTLCKMQTTNYFKLRDQDLLVALDNDIFPGTNLQEKYPNHGWDQYGFYCIPEGVQTAIYTYNKAMFEEVGLDPAAPPTTWDEFFAAAEALTVRDANGTITRAGFQYDDWLFAFNPLYQLGGMIVKRDGDDITANFNTPEMEQAYQFFLDLNQQYQAWDPNFPYISDAIGNRQAATGISEAWVHGVYKTDFPETFAELGFSAPPTPTGEANPYYGRKNAVLSLALIKNRPAAETEAGLKFLEYLVTERIDTQFELANISGLVPAHVDILNSEQVTGDEFLTLGAQLAPREYDTVEVSDSLNQIMADTLNRILLEGQALAGALEQGQADFQALIDAGEIKHVY